MKTIISKKNYFFFIVIIFFAFLIRLLTLYYFRDWNIDNEWGILFQNYKNYKIIGINVFDGDNVTMKVALQNETVLPSIYMPPFYLFFLLFLNLFVSSKNLVLAALIFQSILSIISSLFLFKLLMNFFNTRISLIGFIIFLFFPINIYATSQISSITIQVFFAIIFFYCLFEFLKKKRFFFIAFMSIASSALILLRGEFILFLVFTYFFIFFSNRDIKNIIFSILITFIIISPYLIRNYKTFNSITITKSFGYNLWKGNNLFSDSSGNEKLYDSQMIKKINEIQPNNKYEIERDQVYKEEAIKNILQNPKLFIDLYFNKVFSFLFLDTKSRYPNYYNFFHTIPKIFLGISTLLGILLIKFKEKNLIYFSLLYFLNVSLFSIFFILPRYSVSVLPIQIILSCSLIDYIYKKIKFKSID